MSNQNNGGPAFPSSENGTSHTIAMAAMLQLPENASTDEKDKIYIQTKAQAMQGMSLRDYFAAKAMQAIITGNNADHCSLGLGTAKDAYIVADAMLATRSA